MPGVDDLSCYPYFPGYRVRVLDGNHLPASEKRLAPLRSFRGAALPGHSLVVYDPEAGLVVDIVPCEDAHAQERTLVPSLLATVQPGDLWIADRNFCTATSVLLIVQTEALAKRGRVLVIHGANCPLLEPIESRWCRHVDANALDVLGLGIYRCEISSLAEAREDVEVQIAAWRVVPDGRVLAQEVCGGNVIDGRVVRI